MYRRALAICLFVLVAVWWPGTYTVASAATAEGTTYPPRLTAKEVVDIDVTTIKGRSISLQKLVQHMRETGRYTAETGKPFLRAGRWYLRFFRYVAPAVNLTMPGMYWDSYGKCMRWEYSGLPVSGWRCYERG